MKKKFLLIVLSIALLFSMSSFDVFANSTVSVYLNNQLLRFDVEPQIINGRTVVPMRVTFEKLGATVSWDDNTNTAHAYNYDASKGVSITIGTPHMIDIHMNVIPLDVPAIIQNGRTLVPLRAISEAFSCEVQWDGDTRSVKLFSEDFIDFSNSMATQEEISVSTAEQFLNSIGSNKKIILTSDYYNLSTVKNINNKFIEKQTNWDNTYLNAYVVKNVVNMTIQGNAEIVIDDLSADVLSFEKCKQITLSGLTIGHTSSYEQYQCEGSVTEFVTCNSIYLNNCNLYGCGAFGVYADNTTNLNVTNSKIYDCTYTGIWLSEKSSATVNKTDFFDSIHASGFLRIDNSTISCSDCNIYDIVCNDSGMFIETLDFGGEPSNISFTNCIFKNNRFDTITNDDGNKKITFNNCSFQNNIGNMSHNSVIYNNSITSTAQTTQSSIAKSSSDEQILFLKFVKLAIDCQSSATDNLRNYVKYNFDERYKTLFFENLNIAYESVTSAYEISLKYSDMSNFAEPLKNVLKVYDNIFDGKYSPLTMDDAFTEALSYYQTVSNIANSLLQ